LGCGSRRRCFWRRTSFWPSFRRWFRCRTGLWPGFRCRFRCRTGLLYWPLFWTRLRCGSCFWPRLRSRWFWTRRRSLSPRLGATLWRRTRAHRCGSLRGSRGTRRWCVVRSFDWALSHQRRRMPAASLGSKLRGIRRRLTGMLDLRGYRRGAPVTHDGQFLRRGPRVDSTAPTVIAGAAAVIVRHRIFIDIVNDRSVHIRDRGVVVNAVVVPVRALIAAARISEAVINAAIIADVRTPVARVPMVIAIIETPIRRRPQRTHVRRQHPRTRNPVITRARIAPVTRGPHIVVTGSRRLAVIGKRRRRVRRLDRLIAGGILIVIRRGGWLVAWSAQATVTSLNGALLRQIVALRPYERCTQSPWV